MREPRVLGDRYELHSVIGRGGMAEVYRAHDRVLRREVAVKLMREVADSDRDRARFTAEARTLAQLNHQGLVTILDAATTDDQPYLVMELVRGPSLAECCQSTPLDPLRVAAIGVQLAEALSYAHANDIVHRDLKPANVLLADDDRALLTDFGIAKLLSETSRHTATGQTIGTAAYLAPEQVRGQDVSAATDVYSLGLVLLEALTGERAYRGTPTEAALARLSTAPPIPPDLPHGWRALLDAMTAQAPADRPPTTSVARQLRDLAAGVDAATATAALRTEAGGTRPLTAPVVASRAPHPRVPRGRPVRQPRHWRWVAGTAAVVLALVVVGVLLTTRIGQPESDVPADVPARLQQPLQDLHDAVEGQ
jgi:eukaryotic-like serine/threonine-protein kinase